MSESVAQAANGPISYSGKCERVREGGNCGFGIRVNGLPAGVCLPKENNGGSGPASGEKYERICCINTVTDKDGNVINRYI